jgi:RimJ/RimL family protein N-acetyltransferase
MMTTTINWQPAHLENELVKLIPLAASDFERLYSIAADPLIWAQHPSSNRYQRQVFQGYFDGAIAAQTSFLITETSSGEVIGCTRFYDYKPGESIAIGFTFLARRVWGGDFNKAAKKLLIDYAFQFVDTIYFHIGATNVRSQLATGKIGAIKVNEVEIENNGQKQLHFEYAIRRDAGNFHPDSIQQ